MDVHFSIHGFVSKKLKIAQNAMYQWSDISTMVADVEHGLRVKLFIDDELWYTETVQIKLPVDSPRRWSRKAVTESKWVMLTNKTDKIFIQWGAYSDGVLVSKIFLSASNLLQSASKLIQSVRANGHKITCLLGGEDLSKCFAYLGRAQLITTNHQIQTRVYTWKAKSREAFGGVPLHDNNNNVSEHLRDIKQIKLSVESTQDIHVLLSARNLDKMPRRYEDVVDSDDFSNEYRVLPVGVGCQKTLVIRFYNFKFKQPRSVEVKIPHRDLVTSPSRLTRKLKEIDGVVTVYHDDAMYINSVILIVKDYVNNLEFTAEIALATQ